MRNENRRYLTYLRDLYRFAYFNALILCIRIWVIHLHRIWFQFFFPFWKREIEHCRKKYSSGRRIFVQFLPLGLWKYNFVFYFHFAVNQARYPQKIVDLATAQKPFPRLFVTLFFHIPICFAPEIWGQVGGEKNHNKVRKIFSTHVWSSSETPINPTHLKNKTNNPTLEQRHVAINHIQIPRLHSAKARHPSMQKAPQRPLSLLINLLGENRKLY